MMNGKKKTGKRVLMIVAALVVLVGIGIALRYTFFVKKDKDQYDIYAEELDIDHNGILLLYGDSDFPVRDNLPCRWLKDLTEDELLAPDDRSYHAIVIDNRSGNVVISEEEWKTVQRIAESKKYDFFYFGTKDADAIQKVGFGEINNQRGLCCFYSLKKEYCLSFWTEESEEMLKSNPDIIAVEVLTDISMHFSHSES